MAVIIFFLDKPNDMLTVIPADKPNAMLVIIPADKPDGMMVINFSADKPDNIVGYHSSR